MKGLKEGLGEGADFSEIAGICFLILFVPISKP